MSFQIMADSKERWIKEAFDGNSVTAVEQRLPTIVWGDKLTLFEGKLALCDFKKMVIY